MRSKKEEVRKGVSVEIVDNIPRYVFTGEWSGKDIMQVRGHLYKEYRKYQRSVRLDKLVDLVTKQEVSDDSGK